MGQALAEAFPVCRDTFRRGRRCARRAAEHAVLRGARGAAAADREHAAGDSRRRASRCLGWPARTGSSRRSPPATASASTRRTSRPVRYPSRMPCARCAAEGDTCRKRCRSARARWRPFSGSTRRPSARPARRPRERGEVVTPANLNAPGQVVIAGHAAAVARAGELAKARGAKRVIALAVSAPFHCPLMKPAQERLAPELRALTAHAPAIPGRRQRRRGAEDRRRERDRGADPAGVVAGALGRRRPPADRRRRADVRRARSRHRARGPDQEDRSVGRPW